MSIRSIDHIALPTNDCAALIEFYRQLGFTVVGQAEWSAGQQPFVSLALDDVKINLHDPTLWQNDRFTLRGPTAMPGCGDLCFVWTGTVAEAKATIAAAGGDLVTGPVERVGGRSRGTASGQSVYTRDPDGNLVELITYPS